MPLHLKLNENEPVDFVFRSFCYKTQRRLQNYFVSDKTTLHSIFLTINSIIIIIIIISINLQSAYYVK